MEKEFAVDVPARLDVFLAARVVQLSRAKLQRLIKEGAVKVNGRSVVKPGSAVRRGDKIAVYEEKTSSLKASCAVAPEPDVPLEVVYEDRDIAAVNKPAGLLAHPTASQSRHTLVNALIARYPAMATVGENSLRPGIVHRLDKDTSGLLVAAKTQKAFMFLKRQFMERKVVKKYLALVEGVPKERQGTIRYALRPSKANRLKKVAITRQVAARNGQKAAKESARGAATAYRVRKTFGNRFALVECEPKTGRTHQIRAHLAAIGHPIVGDRMYGSRTAAPRHFLHAYYLGFTAPSGAPLALEIELPKDLKKIIGEVS